MWWRSTKSCADSTDWATAKLPLPPTRLHWRGLASRHGGGPAPQCVAAELGWIALRDALHILLVIDAKDDERFGPAAVRWAGRLALEAPNLELAELAGALESLHALPDENAQRSLLTLAERARRPSGPASAGAIRRSQQPRRRGFVQ